MRRKWYWAVCTICGRETGYDLMRWRFYVEMRKDGIPCDAAQDHLRQCSGRLFPPAPEER